MIFEPGYTVFHCGTLKKKKGEWEMISDTPKTGDAVLEKAALVKELQKAWECATENGIDRITVSLDSNAFKNVIRALKISQPVGDAVLVPLRVWNQAEGRDDYKYTESWNDCLAAIATPPKEEGK
jgi:ribonuclease HI